MNVQGRTVVITGGATGIGFALAKRLAREGARLVLCEPREHRLQEAVEALRGDGADAKYFVADVTDTAQVEALADFTWAENGRGDVIINNAGIAGARQRVLDEPDDLADARNLFDVNFFGVWNGVRTFGRRQREDGLPAGIYATASENSLFLALPTHGAAYVASKHAVLALMETLRNEVPDHIATGVIIPGWVKSEISPRVAPEAMEADAFADIIVPQLLAGEYYLVSHPYNVVRMRERWDEVYAAFEQYAPRHGGDAAMDVRLAIERYRSGRTSGSSSGSPGNA